MRDLVVPAADLLLGARCAGCGGAALLLCRSCASTVRPDPVEVWPPAHRRGLVRPSPVVPVAAGVNAGVLRRVVLAWKEEGVTRLTDVLAHLLAAAVVPNLDGDSPLALVPVPTSRAGRRRRGADLVDDLAGAAASLLRGIDVDVVVARALTYTRTTRDQAGLDASDRASNLGGALVARPRRGPSPRRVVVVDDVLTTGATVAEAVRALTAAGRRPCGISVLAATPRRR